MKEFYIAPEVEIVCFAPIERLATDFWNSYGGVSVFSNGGGNDGSDQHIEVGPSETVSPTDPEYGGEK